MMQKKVGRLGGMVGKGSMVGIVSKEGPEESEDRNQ